MARTFNSRPRGREDEEGGMKWGRGVKGLPREFEFWWLVPFGERQG